MRTVALAMLLMLVAPHFAVTAVADERGTGVRADVLDAIEVELTRLSQQAEKETGPVHPRPSSEVALLLLTGLAAQGTQVEQPAAEEFRQLGLTHSNEVEVQIFAAAEDARVVIGTRAIQDKSGYWTQKRATLYRRQSGKWVQRGSGEASTLDERLSLELDEIVKKAEEKATPRLPKQATSAEDALGYAAAEYADQYRVLEHKGWWVVAWHGHDGSKPVLWLPGFAIRKNSKDYYRFGSW
jgi:hypothetical protein